MGKATNNITELERATHNVVVLVPVDEEKEIEEDNAEIDEHSDDAN